MAQIYFNGAHLGNIICLQKNISGIETLQSDFGAPQIFLRRMRRSPPLFHPF